MEIIATTTFGLEAVAAQEIRDLGYENIQISDGKVEIKADLDAICRLNLWLRSSDRIRLKVGEFKAVTFEELFEKTKKLPWPDLLPKNACFPVEGKSIKSKLFSVSDCQAITKKAVVESMKKRYNCSWFKEDGPLFKIEVALLKDIASITIDTSGPGLHKRGYRKQNTAAPLKETLAAAMIKIARWYPDTTLIDPFCGSGTIPIEAALLGRNIAPGINRNFISETWPLISNKFWNEARKEASDKAKHNLKLDIKGTDIDKQSIFQARQNAAGAGVDDTIHFQQQAVSELSSKRKYGKIICNPPYGERLKDEQVDKLYRKMGSVFQKLDTWSFYILTSHPKFEDIFGKKASKKRKLYNGNIKVDYYQYFGPKLPDKYKKANS